MAADLAHIIVNDGIMLDPVPGLYQSILYVPTGGVFFFITRVADRNDPTANLAVFVFRLFFQMHGNRHAAKIAERAVLGKSEAFKESLLISASVDIVSNAAFLAIFY